MAVTRSARRFAVLSGVAIGVGGFLVGLLWVFQRSLIYHPDSSPVPPAEAAIPGARDLTITTSDGLELGAWLVPAPEALDRGQAVLYAPGNAGNRAGRIAIAELLADHGFTVLLMDYRGFGGNPGSPSEEGLARDAEAAVRSLSDEGFELDQTFFLGESIGTGVVARLQSGHPPAGVLLRSPFTDFAAVAAHHYRFLPVRHLLRDTFPVIEHVSVSDVPFSVVYGSDDSVVPAALSREVAAAAGNLVEEVELTGVDHNEPEMFGTPVADAMLRLADSVSSFTTPEIQSAFGR